MNIQNIQLDDGEIRFIECKFTVECDETLGGDFEKNIGGSQKRRRITFDGYATAELYAALIDAVQKVVD